MNSNEKRLLTTEEIMQMMNLYGLPDTVLYYLVDPDTDENYVEDPELAEITDRLREDLQEFLRHFDLID